MDLRSFEHARRVILCSESLPRRCLIFVYYTRRGERTGGGWTGGSNFSVIYGFRSPVVLNFDFMDLSRKYGEKLSF